MKNIILITHDPLIQNEVLKERIRNIGKHYNFFNGQWVVETDLSPQQVYNKIAQGEFEKISILVVLIDMDSFEQGYWGRMNVDLWNWFKEVKNLNI
ncbi:hypothetical protein [Dysgonomonas sp. ZJ709]|uniref:hypothetical protein n=1 Tax=Dysgonomonas sp. ZJ709 TaxID=2709797 RepID=UPI0013EB61E3|nr:hypothetical protein [Dysgonomonas sp. ZJ709]